MTSARIIPLPSGGDVVRTGATTSYHFEVPDTHGTSTLYLDHTAQTPTWRQFTPYGAPRGPNVTWIDNRGYLGKPNDTTTGLTYLGPRAYDPQTGQFTSPDPVLKTANPQDLNPYPYAFDNPVTNADPTGKMIPNMGGGPPQPTSGDGRATAPDVSNGKLKKLLAAIYSRDRASTAVGDGTAYDAFLEELRTGVKVGDTNAAMHAQKVADSFWGLSKLLEANRKDALKGKPILTEREQEIAYSWAAKLWKALNSPDVTGGVTAEINANPAMKDQIVQAVNNGRTYALRNITGDTFTQTPKGSYTRDTPAEGAVGEAGGFLDGLGGILDVLLPVLLDPHDPLMGACQMTPGCQQMTGSLLSPPPQGSI